MSTQTINTPGAGVWTAPFTGTAIIRCIGAGGNGADVGDLATGGGGGGGGAYTGNGAVPIVFGVGYAYNVGAGGGPPGGSGDTTWDTDVVVAQAGAAAVGEVGGAGGSGENDGGAGGAGGLGLEGGGGGAGGNAVGAGAAGGDGGIGAAGAGGAPFGGTSSDPGGGGNGSTGAGSGNPGVAPGGAGGGAGSLATASTNGVGANGRLTIELTYPTPDPSSVDPDHGVGGTAAVIAGTGFSTGCTVMFGGRQATGVVVDSEVQITCVVPAHAAGLVNVVVTNADLVAGTLTNGYTYTTPPSTGGAASNIGGGNLGSGRIYARQDALAGGYVR